MFIRRQKIIRCKPAGLKDAGRKKRIAYRAGYLQRAHQLGGERKRIRVAPSVSGTLNGTQVRVIAIKPEVLGLKEQE